MPGDARLAHPLLERLDWAEAELERLQGAVEVFLDEQTVTTGEEPNAEATEYVIRVEKGIGAIPFHIALLIGDVAHHARATLDWLAWSVARNPGDKTTFPVWTYRGRDKNGKLLQPTIPGGLTQTARRLVKQVQSYEAGKPEPTAHPLYWLRELDNIHKHRHLVPAACANSGYVSNVPTIHGAMEVEELPCELKAGEEVARVTLSEPNPDLGLDYQPIPYVSVNGISPYLDDLNVVAELRYAMVGYVRKIVIACSRAGLLRR